jgi:hypothetical protein
MSRVKDDPSFRLSGAGRKPIFSAKTKTFWMPVFIGMTKRRVSPATLLSRDLQIRVSMRLDSHA